MQGQQERSGQHKSTNNQREQEKEYHEQMERRACTKRSTREQQPWRQESNNKKETRGRQISGRNKRDICAQGRQERCTCRWAGRQQQLGTHERETTSAGKGNKQEGQRHTNLKGKQRGSSTQQYACDPSGKHVTPRITRSSQVHTQY